MSPPRGTRANIHICLIFLETSVIGLNFCRWWYGSIFIALFAMGSKRRIFASIECVSAVQGYPRSMILVPIESTLCEFLLVRHSNRRPILHRFWDTATYWLKIAYFPTLPLSHSAPPLHMSPLEFRGDVSHEKTTVMGYLQWRMHDRSLSNFDMILGCDGLTDGRNLSYLIQRSAQPAMLTRCKNYI